MKKLLVVIAVLMSIQLSAQNIKYRQSSDDKFHTTAFGALSTQYSRFNGQSAVFTGVYGGLMLNRNLMVGLGGYGLVTKHKGYGLNAVSHSPNNFKMGYGGVVAEYTFYRRNRLSVTGGALVGGGLIKNGNGRGTVPANGSDELKDIDASGFFVVQPSVNIEYAVNNWFHVGAGGGYRYISGSDQQGITDRKMSAPTAGLTFKFGGF